MLAKLCIVLAARILVTDTMSKLLRRKIGYPSGIAIMFFI